MTLLIRGRTVCPLCDKVILRDDKVVGFPAFLGQSHPMARFSDAAFHAECFAASGDKDAVETLFRRYREIWDSRPRNLRTRAEIEAWGKEAFKEFT